MAVPADLQHYWMPFTANRYFKRHPRMLVAAKGMHYTAQDGHRVLDGVAGLWCCNAGHCHPKVVEAVQQQAATLDYGTAFQIGHPKAFELAARLVGLAPEGFGHAFFVNSGSEAVDTALKIALAYHRVRGEGARTRLIGRERGYHGVGFGGISVGGIVPNRRMFGPLLPGVDHLRHTHDLEHNAFTRGQPAWGAHLAEELERIVALHDASTIAAVIVEPIACSTGVLVPPQGYLERLREICDRHGILLIFDEVITGFGRVGEPFAAQRFGVRPDLITVAKGLTNGAVPMGAVLARDGIYQVFESGPEHAIEFFHGYTYSGHPMAAAAGLAALDVYRDEGLFERARTLEPVIEEAAHALNGAERVIDVRNFGLVAAVELEPREGAPTLRATEVFRRCFDLGLLVRATGDVLAVAPPLIVSEAQIGEIFEILARAIREVE